MIPQSRQFKDTTIGFLGLGNMTKLRSNPFGFLLDLAKTQGGIAYIRFGPPGNFYLVSDPEYIREIMGMCYWPCCSRVMSKLVQP
jgi:hypothetical protein